VRKVESKTNLLAGTATGISEGDGGGGGGGSGRAGGRDRSSENKTSMSVSVEEIKSYSLWKSWVSTVDSHIPTPGSF
jgi:hypothetical protein